MTNTPSFIRTFYILSGLAILSPMAMDSFLPAIESAAQGLNTEVGQIMVAFGFLSAGVGVGQIIFGPLSDQFGRRPVIIIGLLLYIVTAGLSATVSSVEPLFILRFCHGVAVASTMIILRAVVRDLFGVQRGANLFAKLFMVLALMPLIGPILGGHLTVWFGWRAVFIMMALSAVVVLLIIYFFLDESLKRENMRSMTPRILAVSFAEIIRDRTFVVFLLVGAGGYGGIFAILTSLAPVMTGLLEQPADIFGYQFAAIMVGHLIAAMLAGRIVDKIGIKKIVIIGTFFMLTGGSLMLGFALAEMTTIYTILVPAAIFLIGFALSVAAMTAGALSNFQHMAGRATSLLGFLQQCSGATVSITLGLTADGTQMPMAIALAGVSAFAFFSFVLLSPGTKLRTD